VDQIEISLEVCLRQKRAYLLQFSQQLLEHWSRTLALPHSLHLPACRFVISLSSLLPGVLNSQQAAGATRMREQALLGATGWLRCLYRRGS
jgi:hypothetical protein